VFSVVRDPVHRFSSAVAEIHARGLSDATSFYGQYLKEVDPKSSLPPEAWCGVMLSSILRKRSFFESHLVPQYRHLLDHSGRVLPLDYLASQEHLDASMGLVYSRLDHPVNSTGRRHWRPHFSPGPGRERAGSQVNRSRVKPTANDTRLICQLYFLDYLALDLEPPSQCIDLFSTVHKASLLALSAIGGDTRKDQGMTLSAKPKSAKGKGKTQKGIPLRTKEEPVQARST